MGFFFLLYLMMKIFEVLFNFIDFKEYNILKDIEMLQNIYISFFYDMYLLRLSIDRVSLQHYSCIAGHRPGIQVVTKMVSELNFVKTPVIWFC